MTMKDGNKLEAVKKFILERKYALWLLLWLAYGLWYALLNRFQTNCHLIHMAVDDKIPFLPVFSIFYVIWYLYIAFALLLTLIKSKRDFLVMCCLIFLALFSSLIVCTIYPSMHDLRPADSEMGTSFFADVVRWHYNHDEPRVILPSMHCIVAIVITVGLICSDTCKGNWLVRILCPILSVLIMLSTVFIKQHSFADVLLAIAMSIPVCLLTYFVILPRKRFEEQAAPAAPEEAAEPDLPPEAPPAEQPAAAMLFLSQDDEFKAEREELAASEEGPEEEK